MVSKSNHHVPFFNHYYTNKAIFRIMFTGHKSYPAELAITSCSVNKKEIIQRKCNVYTMQKRIATIDYPLTIH